MNAEEIKDLSFEDALLRLENIVRELEGGRIKLDDAVAAYEQAKVLKQLCENKLEAARLKIEKIETSAEGSLSATEFTPEGLSPIDSSAEA